MRPLKDVRALEGHEFPGRNKCPARRCAVASCERPTFERKPYCPEHVERNPHASTMAAGAPERAALEVAAEKLERLAKSKKARRQSPEVKAIKWRSRHREAS